MKNPVISITTKEKVESTAKRSMYAEYDLPSTSATKMKRCLTDNLTVVEVERSKDVKLLPMPLIKNNGFTYEITLTKAVDREKLIKFFADSPYCYDFSGKYSKSEERPLAICVFTVSDELTQVQNEDDRLKVEAYQLFTSLNLEEKRAIATYFGERSHDLDSDELTRIMVSLEKGLLTANAQNRKDFITTLDQMFDVKTINIKTAIAYNVIVTDGSVYMIESQVLGQNFNEILQTVTTREDLYNLIIKAMGRAGVNVFRGRNSDEKAAKATAKVDRVVANQKA